MQVSLNWLADYLPLDDLTPAAIAAAFTDIGLEVESIQGGSAIGPEVVVGKVLTAEKHPNADSLRVCTVDVGAAEPLRIVCGAPNARVGIHVAVAQVGATLPGNFKIKKSKIRGEESQGMLCSEQELGISEAHEGIIELPGAPTIGAPAAKILGLEDVSFEINVTPNRADCFGYIGLARDLGARLKRPLKEPLPTVARSTRVATEGSVRVQIDDADLCLRFVALKVSGVSAVPAPRWIQKRLEASGMRPVNLIVDATNYAMLEYSQPVHAYDERDIRGGKIIVRSAREGETLTTLDGQARAVEPGDILICDAEGPIGIAGVMGGQHSEVKADTTSVIIEVAAFAPHRVRKTARRLGMHTEASHRFERGVDVDVLSRVALRVADLIGQGAEAARAAGTKVAVPEIAADEVDTYPGDVSKRVVAVRLSHTKQFLALPQLKKEDVVEALTALQFEMLDSNEDRIVFEVPYWRHDIEREVDLVEEIGRIVGFDKIPYQLPVMNIRPTPEDPLVDFQEQARLALATAGFRETVSFPFVSGAEMEALGFAKGHPLYPSLSLANPLSEQFSMLQTSLVPGLVRAALGNRRHGHKALRLFECGRGYFDFSRGDIDLGKSPTWRLLSRPGRHLGARARSDKNRPTERHWLGVVIDQPWQEQTWNASERRADFYHGKAVVVTLLRDFGISDDAVQFVRIEPKDLPHLHPGAAATVMAGNRAVGYVGELHPQAAARLDFDAGLGAPIIAELDLETLLDLKGKPLKLDTEIRRFPPVTRDVAFLVDQERSHRDMLDAIGKFKAKRHLVRYELFDLYPGSGSADKAPASTLPEGKKSMAYTFVFQSSERTLTETDVEQELAALLAWLSDIVGATQRG